MMIREEEEEEEVVPVVVVVEEKKKTNSAVCLHSAFCILIKIQNPHSSFRTNLQHVEVSQHRDPFNCKSAIE